MIDAIAAAAATDATAAAPVAPRISQTEFLTLFLAQLQHQDPLSPMEPEELTAQLAQLSSLEQLAGINTRLDAMAKAQATPGDLSSALAWLGTEVAVAGGRVAVKDGVSTHASIALAGPVASATATVRDAAGRTIRTIPLGPLGAGEHAIDWDGETTEGTPVPEGTYTIGVAVKPTAADQETPVPVLVRGTVERVDLSTNPPTLIVDGMRVRLAEVRDVRAPSGTI